MTAPEGRRLKVVGQDPSLNNWGLAIATYDLESGTIQVERIDVIQPNVLQGKQVRQNSKDLDVASQLHQGALAACAGAHAVFVEVPIGSQSARAMASYGVCVGVLGALRSQGIPLFEMTPTQVKLAAVKNSNATKDQMIEWASTLYPDINWPRYTRNGVTLITKDKAEHEADAIGAIHAGIACQQFQQLLSLLKNSP